MTTRHRIRTVIASGTRTYRRTPVLLALLIGLPAYAIWVFTVVMPQIPVPVHVGKGVVTSDLPGVAAAFMTPMVAALLTAIAGLFLMGSAANDARLLVTGYRPVEIVLARLGLLAFVGAVATLVSVAVMVTAFSPARLLPFAAAVWLGALVYGMAGVLVGSTLDRLPGVYLVLFGSMVDLFLFQNPIAPETSAVATFFPGHFPMAAAMAAGFTGTIEPTTFAWGLVTLAVFTGAGTLAFYRRTQLV